jgi:hypothetical protein
MLKIGKARGGGIMAESASNQIIPPPDDATDARLHLLGESEANQPASANNGGLEIRAVQQPPRTARHGGTGTRDERPVDVRNEVEIAKIRPAAADARGHEIIEVYFKRSHYAIYRAKFGNNESVAVQFSQNEELALRQQLHISVLLPLRNKLQYLAMHIRGLASSARRDSVGESDHCYFVQIADAFRLGLENDALLAKEVLQGAIDNVTALLERHARLCYLRAAAKTVAYVTCAWLVVMAMPYAAAAIGLPTFSAGVLQVATAIFSGAIGALLSIAIGIRNRTVGLDGDPSANRMEAATRITIGIISAAVLYLMFLQKFFTLFNLEPQLESSDVRAALLIGFAGGFLERLVPDLIEKTMTKPNGKGEAPVAQPLPPGSARQSVTTGDSDIRSPSRAGGGKGYNRRSPTR